MLASGEDHNMARHFLRNGVILLMLLSLVLIIHGKFYTHENKNIFLFIYGLTTTSVILMTFVFTYLRYRDPSEPAQGHSARIRASPSVSCIVAVYNEEKIISHCLQSLINLTYKNKEIIVVNDASTDGTRQVLERFSHIKGVRIINLPKNIGKKRALAQGIFAARGEIFLFTDSDCVVAPDAADKIVRVFTFDPAVGAVSGHGRALNAEENLLTKIQDSWYETQYSIEKALESSYGSVCCVSGPLAAFRREAIFNYIPAWENDTFLGKEFKFATDRQLTGYVLGSTIIGKKLKKRYADSPFVKLKDYPEREWKVVYCKSAKVWTVVPNTFKKLIRQHIRWKKSFVRNLFFTGAFYWRKPVVPALKYYLGALFTIVGPIIAIRHLVYLPLQGDSLSGVYYLSGILFIGALYGLAFKVDHPDSRVWMYRPLMSVLSTLILSWLIFYSLFTIRKPVWHRG